MWYDEINHFLKWQITLSFRMDFWLSFEPKEAVLEDLNHNAIELPRKVRIFSPILEREIAIGANKIEANSVNSAPIFTFNTNLESLRYNDHFELKFVQIGQQLTKRQPRKFLGTGKQSDFF